MFGAYMEGTITGFIGVHDDGSIGLLEVIPEYRRMGVATALQSFMLAEHMKHGWVPYGQVYLDNDASFALQNSMHMSLSDGYIRWMFAAGD